jgi:dihydroneopterin aldolase
MKTNRMDGVEDVAFAVTDRLLEELRLISRTRNISKNKEHINRHLISV